MKKKLNNYVNELSVIYMKTAEEKNLVEFIMMRLDEIQQSDKPKPRLRYFTETLETMKQSSNTAEAFQFIDKVIGRLQTIHTKDKHDK